MARPIALARKRRSRKMARAWHQLLTHVFAGIFPYIDEWQCSVRRVATWNGSLNDGVIHLLEMKIGSSSLLAIAAPLSTSATAAEKYSLSPLGRE